tara:strand:+ start:269 stop:832 length:564 start_codon:yes stop_codon:yes gene_type:complete
MIKIIGGKFKKTNLETIPNFTRATSAQKRESIFSIIDSISLKIKHNFYNGKIFLDLFAGTGAMGLEAISRGAEKAIFYENNSEVINILKKNCYKLCNKNQYEIIEEDILDSEFNINFDNINIIYIDPPYGKYKLNEILFKLSKKIIDSKTIVVLETSKNEYLEINKEYKIINSKIYGKTKLNFINLS